MAKVEFVLLRGAWSDCRSSVVFQGANISLLRSLKSLQRRRGLEPRLRVQLAQAKVAMVKAALYSLD
uniref:Uncharacterized protein n=1 Tax=Anguilla anguilla TaxID=7936 RepID=A0A0E9WWH1_ANGAN